MPKMTAREIRVCLDRAIPAWQEAIWDINKIIASRPAKMHEVQLALHALYRRMGQLHATINEEK